MQTLTLVVNPRGVQTIVLQRQSNDELLYITTELARRTGIEQG
jgi:hypothetical protein